MIHFLKKSIICSENNGQHCLTKDRENMIKLMSLILCAILTEDVQSLVLIATKFVFKTFTCFIFFITVSVE